MITKELIESVHRDGDGDLRLGLNRKFAVCHVAIATNENELKEGCSGASSSKLKTVSRERRSRSSSGRPYTVNSRAREKQDTFMNN